MLQRERRLCRRFLLGLLQGGTKATASLLQSSTGTGVLAKLPFITDNGIVAFKAQVRCERKAYDWK
jgi:hypothetical protein